MKLRFYCLLLALIPMLCASAQDSAEIELDRIFQPKVRKYLDRQHILSTVDLDSIHASCYTEADSAAFQYHEKSFVIEADVEKVWDAYNTISPERAWSSKLASFAFLYRKFSGEIVYHNDDYEGMKEGQVVFMNLQFLGGLFNIAVGHEISCIDEANKFLRICYLENGKSQGSQLIYLTPTEAGHTLVKHITRYKSDSDFRDEKLYPALHSLIISKFHNSVASLAEEEES